MAFITRCCCCELRVGVLIIAVVGIILGSANVAKSIKDVRGFPEARRYTREHPDDLKKYGITLKFFDALEGFTIASIVVNAVSVITNIMIIIPASYTRRGDGLKFRSLLLVWLTWSVIGIIYCLAFVIWSFVVFDIFFAALLICIISIIVIIVVLSLMMVVIAFYQELGETPPAPPVQFGGGYVSQATAFPPGYGFQQPQAPLAGYDKPPEYTEKQGIS